MKSSKGNNGDVIGFLGTSTNGPAFRTGLFKLILYDALSVRSIQLCTCMHACVHAGMCACVRVCMRACV